MCQSRAQFLHAQSREFHDFLREEGEKLVSIGKYVGFVCTKRVLEGERGEVRSRSVGFWGAHSDVREEKGKEERRRKEMHFPASSSVGCRPEEEEHFSQPHDDAIVEPEYRFVLLPAGAFTFPLSLPPFTACLLQCLSFLCTAVT